MEIVGATMMMIVTDDVDVALEAEEETVQEVTVESAKVVVEAGEAQEADLVPSQTSDTVDHREESLFQNLAVHVAAGASHQTTETLINMLITNKRLCRHTLAFY